jgi:hypothetical protein
MRKIRCIMLMFFLVSTFNVAYPLDLKRVDALNHDGKFEESLKLLKESFDPQKPDLAIVWRMSRDTFELAEAIPSSKKKEKIDKYTEAMDIAKPYLDVTYGEKSDRANVVFFYASNFGSRGRVIGIKQSLDNLPELKSLADRALEIDPTLSLAYLLKAKIEEEVPSFLGGDKFKMGLFYSQSLKYDPQNLTVLYDAANALYNRNWDVNKKKSMSDKLKTSDGTPPDLTDRQYAKKIADSAVQAYKNLTNPSLRDTEQYGNVLKLLKSL